MAISQSSVWEIRSSATASNVNGGFFVTGSSGTDFSQQDSAAYNLTGLTSAGAGNIVLTSAAAADMVGNGAYVVSGTNFTSTVAGGLNRFEVVSVVVGVSITFSTNTAGTLISTGVGAAGVINIGGALSLGTTDDAVFEAAEPGNMYHIKNGSYSFGGTVNTAKAGGVSNPIKIMGYNTSRGDKPTDSTRPTIDCLATTYTMGVNWEHEYLIFKGTNTSVVNGVGSYKARFVKFINTSTTAARTAFQSSNNNFLQGCEAISYRGDGITASGTVMLVGCHIHSSNIGLKNISTANFFELIDSVIEGCVTAAVNTSVAAAGKSMIYNCTLFGSLNTTGIGLSLTAGTTNIKIMNSIISGFATGVSHADVQSIGFDDFNNYYNNDTDVSNWTKGASDIAVDPGFANVAQLTGTTATTSGSVLTQSGADFTASGVVAGRDYIYLVSGTGVTVGIYGITAVGTTTLTLDIAPGTNATADKVWQINVGRNFAVGLGVRNKAFPTLYPGASISSYTNIGAAQAMPGYPKKVR